MSDTIELLTDRDKVRQRPGMYIGDNAELGLSTIVREIIDNAVDEYPNYPDQTKPIVVILHSDNSVTVRDYGRGISPYESKKYPGKIEERLAYTVIGAGGKFKSNRVQNGNQFSAGLNGTGSAATNFMSEYYDVTIYKDGYVFHDRFENGGIPVEKLVKGQLPKRKQTGKHETGTLIRFKPDATVMQATVIDHNKLENYFTQTAYLHPGLKILFTNERDGDEEATEYYSENGLLDYINALAEPDDDESEKTEFLIKPFIVSGDTETNVLGEDIAMQANIAIGFTKKDQFASEAFTNGTYNSQGGTHVTGFQSGLVKLMKHYYSEFQGEIDSKYKKEIDFIKKINKITDISSLFKSRNLSRKVFAIVDLKHSNPILQPQTKDKLASPEAKSAVENIFYNNAMLYLDKNAPAIIKILGSIAQDLYYIAKEDDANIKIDKKAESFAVSTKLAASKGTNPEINELILVEGDSAAGTLKANRDSNFQAILPLRGKVLNVQKATLSSALANLEISTIVSVLGAGFGKNFDISKLKYNKIIIGTDQDVDGLHIRVLLLTLFMKYMPELVTGGHVYYLDTPLFVNEMKKPKGSKVSVMKYTYSNEEQAEFVKANRGKIISISRNKGLGELSKDQVIETILEPHSRKLTQIIVEDEDEAYELIDRLMGDNAQGRKRLLMTGE